MAAGTGCWLFNFTRCTRGATGGIGDFSDLARLIELAAALGAAGIGLNPLHALFPDRAQEASPYAPNSRIFINPLYIDVDAIPEFPGAAAAGIDLDPLRGGELIDYVGVARAKLDCPASCLRAFRDVCGRGSSRGVRALPGRAGRAAFALFMF